MLDGHDTKICYHKNLKHNNQHLSRGEYYSFKLRKPGLRTQVMMDINEYILYVSDTEPCAKCNDGTMFVRTRVDRKITVNDCVMTDGIYAHYINNIVQLNNQEQGNNDFENFCCPIRKQRNVQSNPEDLNYNKKHSGLRSMIETKFAHINKIFSRFSPNQIVKRCDSKVYGLQLFFMFVIKY